MSENKTQASMAKARVQSAIGHLEAAYNDLENIVGSTHGAAIALRTALVQARVADAKLDIVIKRIPT